MTINVSFNSMEEMEEFAKQLVSSQGGMKTEKEVVPRQKKREAKLEEIQETVTEVETSEKKKVTSTISLATLRPEFVNRMKAGKREEVKTVLNELGVEKLTDIKEEDYERAYQLIMEVA